MIPITSSAGWVLLYWLCSRTVCPVVIVARSPVQVDIFSTLCTSIGSRVASDRQISSPSSWTPFLASTATPWPCRCPNMATTLPGTLTVQSQWVSENPAGMEYSESPHWSMSSHTGLSRFTLSELGRLVKVTWTYTVLDVAAWFIRSTSRFQES